MKFRFLLFAFFLYISADVFAFDIPEKLHYDLTWAGIKAGESILEAKDNGTDIQFISKANSAKWVSIFYTVEDTVVSTLKKERFQNFVGVPQNYRIKIREGRHRRDKEIIFDRTSKKVTYINHLDKEKIDFDIDTSSLLDPLSSFYYVRTLSLEVGKSVFIDVFDNKKLYKVEIQVLNKETVETPLGTFKTILIKPIMKSEGIFYRKGDILIWLTDDEKKIPVMLKTKVPVGSVKAVLVNGKY